jgi:hypothetical protein
MTNDELTRLIAAIPGVQPGPDTRNPDFVVGGETLAQIFEERDLMVPGFTPEEVDGLLETDARVFHATYSLRNLGRVMLRLAPLTAEVAKSTLERRLAKIA